MAGDWIPIRLDLHCSHKVIGISTITGLDEDEVVGKLVRIWAWGNRNTYDGTVDRMPIEFLDRLVDCPGFTKAMIEVNWLELTDTGFRFPSFSKWNSCSAKKQSAGKFRRTGMSVYFIQQGEDGPIKIGVSDNPQRRLNFLQTGCHKVLRLVATIHSEGQELERKIHKRFSYLRLHGEWFSPGKDLLEYIKKLQSQ